MFFARPVYNEQLYSLIVRSKVGLFSPLAKKHSQFKLLVNFFFLGQKANSTVYDTYLFQINFFFSRGAVCGPKVKPKCPTKHRPQNFN
jgi:hypothetical protein